MAFHTQPLKKAKKQGELPLPSLSPIVFIKGRIRDGIGLRMGVAFPFSLLF